MNLFQEAKTILDKDGKVNPLGPYGKMKLTGREVSTYFRRNKVKPGDIKKAVEVALDMGGAMDIASKEIKKFFGDAILKAKEVQNALRYANEETFRDDLNLLDEKFKPYSDKNYPRCVDFYIQFRGGKGDRITSEENKKDFEKATKMIDAYCKSNKIKQKPVYSTPEEGSSAYKVGLMIDPSYSKTDDYKRGIDLQPLYVSLSKLKTSEDHGGGWDKIVKGPLPKLEMKEGSMDGSKLTGQEISVYFRRHKVRDKMTRKAVEYALDHGGAMKYAIKGIEKMKKGLSKNKDVQKALNYANYGTEQKVPEVGFMFKENSPIAGNMQVEGDPYIPQKKGVNKNIANYWKKEIKGISQKELEAVQSMYMITDHSGVIQMYKAGKRAFIKSLK